METKIKNVISLLIGAIIIFLAGCFFGKSLVPVVDVGKVKLEVKQEMLNGFRQKLNSKIEEDLLPMFVRLRERGEMPLTSLTGKISVVNVQNNTLKVKVSNLYEAGDFFDYLNEPNYYIKTVRVDEETKIVEQESRDRGEYIKEMEEYARKGRVGPAPEPYIETELSIEDLEEGWEVTIDTESEFKLEEEKVIQAKKIIIRE